MSPVTIDFKTATSNTKLLVILAATLLTLGCASAPPKNASEAVSKFKEFLLAIETPFNTRIQLLGLKTNIDPTKLSINDVFRLDVSSGNFVRFARLKIIKEQPQLYLGSMTIIFDTAVICVKHTDIATLGLINPNMPIFTHRILEDRTMTHTLTPNGHGYIRLPSHYGLVHISLVTFERGCLAEVEHAIQIKK